MTKTCIASAVDAAVDTFRGDAAPTKAQRACILEAVGRPADYTEAFLCASRVACRVLEGNLGVTGRGILNGATRATWSCCYRHRGEAR